MGAEEARHMDRIPSARGVVAGNKRVASLRMAAYG